MPKYNMSRFSNTHLIQEAMILTYIKCLCVDQGAVVNAKRAVICVWERQSLHCTDEDRIKIISAKYGQLVATRCNNTDRENTSFCGESDVVSFVKARCEQRIACVFELPDKKLDNMTVSTCPKSAIKTLEIVYQCMSSKFCCYTCNFIPCSVVTHIILLSQRSIECNLN